MTIVNMSDNEDLLADDLGDHSLADYNLGNDEEDQLLADDYESGGTQNVPASIPPYNVAIEAPAEYSQPEVQYPKQRIQYHLQPDTAECVVPNITVEVPNTAERPSYAPYEPLETYEVPSAIPAAPMESPQIVPTEMSGVPDGSVGARSRFPSERPVGAQRTPQHRDIPDTLDKVLVPRGGWAGGRGRTTWRAPHYQQQPRFNHYRRNNVQRGNFNPRAQFPPPRNMRPNSPQMPPQMRPDMQPDVPLNIRPDLPLNMHPDLSPNRPDLPPNVRPDLIPNRPDLPPNRPDLPPNRPDLPPNVRPDLPEGLHPNSEIPHPEFRPEMRLELPLPPGQDLPPEGIIMEPFRPHMERPPFRYEPRHFNPNVRPNFDPNVRPNFDPFYRPFRPFPPMREVAPNMNHIPQVTIRHGPPGPMVAKQEVRMLPVQLPPVPGGLAGKKVLINPHFKGNFQPPVDVLTAAPLYIPTRIQKTPPPLSPTLESKFGPVKDIDDAAERFIAEQRNALARAATRKFPPRRSPQRYIENTTIEIENELARPPRRRSEDDDLLRRQEEFINANRAGLRRRMRSPTPPRRSASPRRSPPRPDRPERLRARIDTNREGEEEDGEYRRRMREQEALRDRVMRAKEARRRKRAVAATEPAYPPAFTNRPDDRERDRLLDKEPPKPRSDPKPKPTPQEPHKDPDPTSAVPDTTRSSPEKEKEKERDRSPVRKEDEAEVNSTSEGLTPPLKPAPADSDDDLDLILGDIDGILSDDDDTGRFKQKHTKPEPPKPHTDLRSKLPPKSTKTEEKKLPKQRIVFGEEKEEKREKPERKRKEKTPPKKAVISSTKAVEEKKVAKAKEITPPLKESKLSMRQRITFKKEQAEKEKEAEKEKPKETSKASFTNRRVILQRKVSQTDKSVFTRIEVKTDPTKPNPGIFSRAVRTLNNDKSRIVVNKKIEEPQIEYESDSEIDEDRLLEEEIGNVAMVTNLPHGMTDTRLKTLAGGDVQTLNLDKEERSAKITFKTTIAAESFKRKFNNKMVAASRLAVTLK